MCKYQSQKGTKWSSTEKDNKHKVCGHVTSIVTLKSPQQIGVYRLFFYYMFIYSDDTMITTKEYMSNFVVKSLYVDDLLIARNGVELLIKAKGLVII